MGLEVCRTTNEGCMALTMLAYSDHEFSRAPGTDPDDFALRVTAEEMDLTRRAQTLCGETCGIQALGAALAIKYTAFQNVEYERKHGTTTS